MEKFEILNGLEICNKMNKYENKRLGIGQLYLKPINVKKNEHTYTYYKWHMVLPRPEITRNGVEGRISKKQIRHRQDNLYTYTKYMKQSDLTNVLGRKYNLHKMVKYREQMEFTEDGTVIMPVHIYDEIFQNTEFINDDNYLAIQKQIKGDVIYE